MGYNFPNAPATGATYTPSGGPTYTWDGIAWKSVQQGVPVTVYVSDTPPPSPAPGQLWWNSTTGNMAIWYSDPDSAQWVQVSGSVSDIPVPPMTLTVLTANGTYVKPAGLRHLEVWVVGGGGGGGVSAGGNGTTSSSGGGGAGGGVCYKLYAASALAASIAYTIGSGGAGGMSGGTGENGVTGGNSSFAGMSSGGGQGGGWVPTQGTVGMSANGGAASTVSGGDLNLIAQNGQMGVANPHGRMGTVLQGYPGGNFFATSNGAATIVLQAAGSPGRFPGGGGSGGASTTSVVLGGGGSPGCIILKEYF